MIGLRFNDGVRPVLFDLREHTQPRWACDLFDNSIPGLPPKCGNPGLNCTTASRWEDLNLIRAFFGL